MTAQAGGAISSAADATRRQLRRQFRAVRRALTPLVRARASKAAARILARHGLPRPGSRVAVYLPADGEFDPAAIVRLALTRGCTVYLPVIRSRRAWRMCFGPLDAPRRAWRRNYFGCMEPGALPRLLVAARSLDLVLVPLVAFDAHCNRLGMGGGYFDRAFAYQRQHARWRRPRLLGLAFECQQVPALAAEGWDVPLAGVLTEAQLLRRPPT